jgi:hypothetical protein
MTGSRASVRVRGIPSDKWQVIGLGGGWPWHATSVVVGAVVRVLLGEVGAQPPDRLPSGRPC